jgi:hypothetical protein
MEKIYKKENLLETDTKENASKKISYSGNKRRSACIYRQHKKVKIMLEGVKM